MGYEAASEKRKRQLADSLKKLMRQKPFSKISINDIVNDCGVNRKTFYYHFSDIYSLLKWMLEQETVEVVRNFDMLVDAEDAITFMVDYVIANRHILSSAYDSIGREEMRRFFYSDLIQEISAYIDCAEAEAGLSVDVNFKKFLTDFLAEAVAGNLINMLNEEFPYEREQIIGNLLLILRSSIRGVLAAEADPRSN